MTSNRELDCVIIGFSIGALAFLWIGYRLRVRVERWHARRATRAKEFRRQAKTMSFITGELGPQKVEQRLLHVPADKPRVIPFAPKRNTVYTDVAACGPSKVDPDPTDTLHWSHPDHPANATAQAIRTDALAALTGAGFKRAAAEAALDTCTLVERAGGLESWVAAALRRATSK